MNVTGMFGARTLLVFLSAAVIGGCGGWRAVAHGIRRIRRSCEGHRRTGQPHVLAEDFTATLPELVFRNRQEFLDMIVKPRPLPT